MTVSMWTGPCFGAGKWWEETSLDTKDLPRRRILNQVAKNPTNDVSRVVSPSMPSCHVKIDKEFTKQPWVKMLQSMDHEMLCTTTGPPHPNDFAHMLEQLFATDIIPPQVLEVTSEPLWQWSELMKSMNESAENSI